jgi:hypothetical protein
MPINVFVSVGRTFNPQQELFVSSVENYLTEAGLRPRTVGRNDFTHKQPLQLIDELMCRSAGALILALERVAIDQGKERGGPPAGVRIENELLSTPWNQIEAAFAYARRLPILVVRELGVRAEGLLEGRYDWFVHSTPLDPAFLTSNDFIGTFRSWQREVKKRAGFFACRR